MGKRWHFPSSSQYPINYIIGLGIIFTISIEWVKKPFKEEGIEDGRLLENDPVKEIEKTKAQPKANPMTGKEEFGKGREGDVQTPIYGQQLGMC
jgi:hypothetical protein